MDKIFISSTCYDLIDLRAVLEQEIKEIGLNPIMSDSLTSDFEIATSTNSIETCLINLRKCDIVIVILSQRYGPSLEKSGFDNISATHLEYREAIKNNIPVYFYVRDLFEADFNVFNKTKDVSLLKWVKAKDKQIFDFFIEHKGLINADKNNWFYSFTNVTDLKNRIRKDLKKQSAGSFLNKIIENGEAPCLIVENIKAELIPNTDFISFSLTLKNVGNSVAIQPYANIYYYSEYLEASKINTTPDFIDDSLKIIETLFPKQEYNLNFNIQIPEKNLETKVLILLFEASYATITGHYLGDLSELEFELEETKIKAYYNYETKKYFHSDAIKREIQN